MAKDEISEVISSEEEDETEKSEEEEEEMDAEEEQSDGADENATTRVYLPQAGADQQELECDETAYICYHSIKTGKS